MENVFYLPFVEGGVYERTLHPIERRGVPVSFALIEVGSTTLTKFSQLKKKKDYIWDFWKKHISSDENGYSLPDVFKFMSHFTPRETSLDANSDYSIDASIRHKWVTRKSIDSLTQSQKENLYLRAYDEQDNDNLREYIANRDAKKLHELLFIPKKPSLINARGYLAEVLAQEFINKSLNSAINSYDNARFSFINKDYIGTEIDMVMQTWDVDTYALLLENLSKFDNLDVNYDLFKNRQLNKSA